jgi:hypothetical protein
MASAMINKIKQGIAPCRGMAEALLSVDFFLIFGAAIQTGDVHRARTSLRAYFLNRLSNAARASVALRGAELVPFSPTRPAVPEGSASRATVTRGEKKSHVLAWSLRGMRIGIGLTHWNRVDGSKFTHCLQQCRAAWHFGHSPLKSISAANATPQLKHLDATTFSTRRGSFGPVTSRGGLGPGCLWRSE